MKIKLVLILIGMAFFVNSTQAEAQQDGYYCDARRVYNENGDYVGCRLTVTTSGSDLEFEVAVPEDYCNCYYIRLLAKGVL